MTITTEEPKAQDDNELSPNEKSQMGSREFSHRAKAPSLSEITAPSSSSSDRSTRVASIIVQAAQKSTSHIAEKSSNQSWKSFSRPSRKTKVEFDFTEEVRDYENKAQSQPGFSYTPDPYNPETSKYEEGFSKNEGLSSPTAKDIRGQTFYSSSKNYNLPVPPAFALLDISKPTKRSISFSSAMKMVFNKKVAMWVGITSLILFMLTFLSLFGSFILLDPKQPKYELTKVQVQWWMSWKDLNGFYNDTNSNGLVNSPHVYLYADAILSVEAVNPNKNIMVRYDNTTIEVFYQGIPLGVVHAQPFHQDAQNSTQLQIEWRCDGIDVVDVGHYLEADELVGAIPLTIKMIVDTSAEISKFITPRIQRVFTYEIYITPPKTNKT